MATAPTSEAAPPRPSRLNPWVLGAGLAVVVPLLAVLVMNLGRDPHSIRSPLVGRPAPAFSLKPCVPISIAPHQGASELQSAAGFIIPVSPSGFNRDLPGSTFLISFIPFAVVWNQTLMLP